MFYDGVKEMSNREFLEMYKQEKESHEKWQQEYERREKQINFTNSQAYGMIKMLRDILYSAYMGHSERYELLKCEYGDMFQDEPKLAKDVLSAFEEYAFYTDQEGVSSVINPLPFK